MAQVLREHTPGVAEAAAQAFDRIAFVALVTCAQAAQLHAAIARALQLPPGGADAAEGLGLALAGSGCCGCCGCWTTSGSSSAVPDRPRTSRRPVDTITKLDGEHVGQVVIGA